MRRVSLAAVRVAKVYLLHYDPVHPSRFTLHVTIFPSHTGSSFPFGSQPLYSSWLLSSPFSTRKARGWHPVCGIVPSLSTHAQ